MILLSRWEYFAHTYYSPTLSLTLTDVCLKVGRSILSVLAKEPELLYV